MNNQHTPINRFSYWHYLFRAVLLCALAGFGWAVNVEAQATYSIDVTTRGDTVTVQWSAAKNQILSTGWVGIFQVGDTDQQYRRYAFIDSGTSGGAVTMSFVEPGTYQARLFSGNEYDRLASSATFTVGGGDHGTDGSGGDDGSGGAGGGSYTVASTQNSVSGDAVSIEWSAPSNQTIDTGWVGIFGVGASDEQYYRWAYVIGGTSGGIVTLSDVQPGTYQARLFSGNEYDRLASSATFTVGDDEESDPGGSSGSYTLYLSTNLIVPGGSVTITIRTPSSDDRNRDWIGLYQVGASNESYIDWQYVDSDTTSSATVVIDSAGQYEFRYLKNDGYEEVAVSSTLTVSGTGNSTQCPVGNLNSITNYPPASGPIIAFGDSLTAGVGATPGQDYVSQLERMSGVTIINAGVSGDTTRTALTRLEADVLSRDPSTVIVWLGGNDILVHYYRRLISRLESPTLIEIVQRTLGRLGSNIVSAPVILPDETFQNLETIVRRIQADGAVVILVGFSGQPFNTNLDSRFRAVAEGTGAIYVPDVLSGVIGRSSRMSDLIHPNDVGYGIVADRINQQLSCVLGGGLNDTTICTPESNVSCPQSFIRTLLWREVYLFHRRIPESPLGFE